MSQKQFDSRNWNNARQSLAEAYQRLNNRRKDYREKLASWDTQEYDAVFLEDLDVGSMMRQNNHSRNIASMSWYKLTRAFERHGEKHGCYVVKVPPERTTKRCAKCSVCGVESDKPLWVREHSCPSCGYVVDRDYNSSMEVHRLGLEKLGVDFHKSELFDAAQESMIGLGQSESPSVETGIPEGACHRDRLLSHSAAQLTCGQRSRESTARGEQGQGSPTLTGATAE